MHKVRGFSLIEVAMVLAIVSIAFVATASLFANVLVNSREKATRTKLESIKTALSTFLVRNNRLPCPADRTLAAGAAGNGVEGATPGTCTGAVTSGAAPDIVKTGAIPWASLGIAEEASLDAFGNRFTYQVMAVATNLTPATVAGMLGSISIHSAGLGVAGNQINNCATPTYNPCGAVVVIVSHGTNGYGAFTSAGQQVPFPATVTGNDERENSNGDRQFVVKSYSDVSANPYDDMVLAITAGEFLTPLSENGSVKNYQTQINEKMAVIKGAVIANAFANSDTPGGERRYQFPAALPALPAAQLNDPWGTPIVYNRVTSSVRCSTAPATDTVFTLTSRGQNPNVAAPADDITITVTVAEIVAVIARAGCNM